MSTTTLITRQDKARGLLLGVALGDALGAPFEGRSAVGAADVAADEQSSRSLAYTDDTALTLVLAEHLAQHRGTNVVEQDALAREFARAWRAEPWRGYGGGVSALLQLVNAGTPWQRATRAVYQDGSYGNGAAMRVAPVALIATSPHNAADVAVRTAEVTHAHEHGRYGAGCQALAVYLALHGEPSREVDTVRFVQDLTRVIRSRPWHEKLDRVVELAHHHVGPDLAARQLGNDISALGSVPMALLAFLLHPDHPVDAIRYAIRGGGDTDTIAAMTGALVGARHGHAALPPEWIQRLEAASRLRATAERLA